MQSKAPKMIKTQELQRASSMTITRALPETRQGAFCGLLDPSRKFQGFLLQGILTSE